PLATTAAPRRNRARGRAQCPGVLGRMPARRDGRHGLARRERCPRTHRRSSHGRRPAARGSDRNRTQRNANGSVIMAKKDKDKRNPEPPIVLRDVLASKPDLVVHGADLTVTARALAKWLAEKCENLFLHNGKPALVIPADH